MIAMLLAAVLASPHALPQLPVEPDLPTEKLERWISREGFSELEADQVRDPVPAGAISSLRPV